MKIIIDCTKPVVDLDGGALKDMQGKELTIGKAIANLLNSKDKPSDPLKYHLLAVDFYKNPSMEIDESDRQLIKDAAKENKFGYFVMVIGQVLLALEEDKKKR